MIDLRRVLNAEQYAAATAPAGPALVIAAAGSGKTRTITHRVAYLVDQGTPADRILLLTFTNKAAKEMLERVEALLPGRAAGVWGGTFHWLAHRLLRAHGARLGLPADFALLDESDARDVLKAVRADLGDNKDALPGVDVLAQVLSLSQTSGQAIASVLAARFPDWVGRPDIFHAAHAKYQRAKRQSNLLDFDDLLTGLLRLLTDCPDVRERYADKFLQVLVDEVQDTAPCEAQIVDLLAGRHRNLMVVGDDGQSIYSFRGADVNNILSFSARWPDARVYRLETNYRSRPPVLAVANVTISRAKRALPKTLRPARTGGALPLVRVFQTSGQEAEYVADEIVRLLRRGVAPAEIAVLYRAHFHANELQMHLASRKIACDVRSGVRFQEKAHVKDVLAHLRAVLTPSDQLAWQRVLCLMEGIGAAGADRFYKAMSQAPDALEFALGPDAVGALPAKARPAWAGIARRLSGVRQHLQFDDAAGAIAAVRRAGYDAYLLATQRDANDRILELEQLISFAGQFEKPDDFLAGMALAGRDSPAERGRRPVLTTVHQAKGLEWQYVFVIGLAEGSFPSSLALADADGAEEERRLFYVAVTRAKERLCLTCPHLRRGQYQEESRFLAEIPAGLCERREVVGQETRPGSGYRDGWGRGSGRDRQPAPRRLASTGLFRPAARPTSPARPASRPAGPGETPGAAPLPPVRPGERVRHPTFGVGTVVEVESGRDPVLRIRFDTAGEKRLMQRFAKLDPARE